MRFNINLSDTVSFFVDNETPYLDLSPNTIIGFKFKDTETSPTTIAKHTIINDIIALFCGGSRIRHSNPDSYKFFTLNAKEHFESLVNGFDFKPFYAKTTSKILSVNTFIKIETNGNINLSTDIQKQVLNAFLLSDVYSVTKNKFKVKINDTVLTVHLELDKASPDILNVLY